MKDAERVAITMSQASARLAPAPGDAVDRRDHRHRQALQSEDQRLVIALDGFAEVRARPPGRNLAVAEILPGTEAAARAC
jgi:hypothetical protein